MKYQFETKSIVDIKSFGTKFSCLSEIVTAAHDIFSS